MKIYVNFVLVLILFMLPLNVYASNWRWVTSTDTSSYYIDSSSIYCKYDGNTTNLIFWEKIIDEDPSGRERQAQSIKRDYPEYDFSDYYYSIIKYEYLVRPPSRLVRVISSHYYDSKGNIIVSDNSISKWNDVIPDSIGEYIALKTIEIYLESVIQ